MRHISTYLKRLKFDPALSKSLIAKYIVNLRLIFLIVLGIIVFGAYSFMNLPRNLLPDINIAMVTVNTVLPGANPEDVESLVTIPLEDAVRGVDKIKTVQSSSLESVSSMVIEFETGVDPDKAKTDVQSAVDGVTLPENAVDPNVTKIDFQKTPIWVFSLTGKDKASLLRFSKELKQDLTDLPTIDEVSVSGLDDQEIQIIVKPEAISSFNVNPQQLIGAVKTALHAFPAGNVKTDNSSFSLTINPNILSIDDIRRLKINLDGQILSIGDIATVEEKSKPDQGSSYIASKDLGIKPSVSFSVFRVTTVNIDKANEDAQKLVEEHLKREGGRFELHTITNFAEQIVEQFDQLYHDLVTTIILVAIVLFIFLGARQAAVALLATPLTFLISFTVMSLTGISLNFLSAFALLLSLGLLVDDTIVVVSAVTAYHRSGKFTPLQTGLLVWKDFIVAITTTTTTTVWAFLPILISTGIIGEFIKPIPIVVSTTLIGSFFVAMFITLPFILFLLKPSFPRRVVILGRILLILTTIILLFVSLPKNSLLLFQVLVFMVLVFFTYQIRGDIIKKVKSYSKFKFFKKHAGKVENYVDDGVLSLHRVEYNYSRFIYRILNSQKARRTILTMVIIFSVFSYLLLPLGLVKNEFFPKTDEDIITISVELPTGTNVSTSRKEALKVLDELKDTPETKFVILDLGAASGFFGAASASTNNFLYSVVLHPDKERKLTSSEISEGLRKEFASYNAGTLSVVEQTGGPPAGEDIQIKLFGPDLSVLNQYADKVVEYLKDQPGATNVKKSIKQGTSKIVFVPNQDNLSQNSLTADTVGFWLRFFATGVKIDTIKIDEELNISQDITLRMDSNSPNAEDIGNINIPTQNNGLIPLTSLGSLKLEPNPTLITREDGKRTISITASVKSGYTVPQVNSGLEAFAKDRLDLTSDYTWATGGANEENQKSVNSILQAMLISILLIIITMVLQFTSFRKAFIVITVIPLSISGVFVVFAITQTALTFPALVGVLALFGIVVKNSILVVDKITANIKTGMEFKESIADAASSRLEPIALTSISAIVGLVPITISDPLWRGLGGAIIAGLTFSGTIMLIFIPVIYYLTFNPSKKTKKS